MIATAHHMKQTCAKIALGCSLCLFFTGLFVLCYCPGWFAAGLAALGASLGSSKIRVASLACFFVSVVFTTVHTKLKIAQEKSLQELRLRQENQGSPSDISTPKTRD